ncbi:MAG: hypothetical protein ISP49_11210 [Reyranella sp.]|jgi:hypothetical protein|nr:hypothetical protein [Reyranella sp.]
MNRKPLLLLGLCLASMAGAEARADDMAYCASLSDMYKRYLGQSSNRGPIPDAAASNAMTECQKGNTAAGIPVLEKRLTDARFTLPKRN